MREMLTERSIKGAVGAVLALVIGCIPASDDSDAGTDGGTGATGSASNALVPIGADALCKHLINDCGQSMTQEDCLNNYLPLRVSASCASQAPVASCGDLTDPSSALSQLCFPSCTTADTPATCHADGTITLCTTAGTTHVNDCAQSCTADGYSAWTGSCGTTFDGQTADQSQCWCR